MVTFKKNGREHCWEYMNCSPDIMKQCFAYQSDTEEQCWVLNNVTRRDGCKILDSCKRCPWFLKNTP